MGEQKPHKGRLHPEGGKNKPFRVFSGSDTKAGTRLKIII